MNFWNKLFLNGVQKFPYGSITIEWPNGTIKKINANNNGPNAHLRITDNNVIKEIIHGGSINKSNKCRVSLEFKFHASM